MGKRKLGKVSKSQNITFMIAQALTSLILSIAQALTPLILSIKEIYFRANIHVLFLYSCMHPLGNYWP